MLPSLESFSQSQSLCSKAGYSSTTYWPYNHCFAISRQFICSCLRVRQPELGLFLHCKMGPVDTKWRSKSRDAHSLKMPGDV